MGSIFFVELTFLCRNIFWSLSWLYWDNWYWSFRSTHYISILQYVSCKWITWPKQLTFLSFWHGGNLKVLILWITTWFFFFRNLLDLIIVIGPRLDPETLPKAQRTRGLSSAHQSNLFRSYHKFKQKILIKFYPQSHITSSNKKSWSNFILRVSTKH